ncbi:lantibiotic dehydratase [Sphaerisporangium sp. NPDC049002]|uniref:lantibiotic dehydratase n=1 Tax=Sphaerisporangium sp. NPDC049002 TaxID=3155392 RepID=UPI0033EF54E3
MLIEGVTVASGPAANASGRSLAAGLTWRAYATRSRTRTTPHGVFTAVAPAAFSGDPELRLGAAHRTLTNPDPQWLCLLARSIIDDADGLEKVRLTSSNVAVLRGDRWEIERPMDPESAAPVTISIRHTDVTAFVLATCRDGESAAHVVAEVARRWRRAAPGSGPGLVRELIHNGFLLHDLLPRDLRCDPLRHLLGRLPDGSPRRDLLTRLRDQLSEADRHRPGSTMRLALLTAALEVGQQVLPADGLLRVDTVADATVALPARVAQQAAEAADVLWRIGWGIDPLTDFHQRFLTRYGTSRAVPLLDVLDPVVGLGPVEDLTHIGAGPLDPRREAVLARLLSQAVSEGRTAIDVDEATIDRLTNRSDAAVPRTGEIYVRVLAGDAGQLADHRFQVAVCGGSQDALSTIGRFIPLLGRPQHTQDTEAEGGALVAELVVRPRTGSVISVTAETGLAAHRIPVGVAPRVGDLDLTNLNVFSNGHHLIVWSKAHNQRVRPVLYSRVALSLLPPVARFLALAGHAGERPWHCWSWAGIAAPFTPAVRYRDTWLAPARWVLPTHLTLAARQAAAGADGWEAALTSWRSVTRPPPPDIVVTDDVDRRLPLDLRRSDDRELLRRYVRRGLAAVTAPPGDDQAIAAVMAGPDGHHLLELVVSLDRTTPTCAPALAAPPVRRLGEGLHLPGGPWLSLAVEAPPACYEQILRSLARQARDLAGAWDRWFWLRYHDQRHGEHLRVRFHADPAVLNGTVLPALSDWAATLHQQRLISGFCVEPYEQEIERYGGDGAITAAEHFFGADSRLALDVLSTVRDEDQRLVIAAITTATIAARTRTAVHGERLGRETHRRMNSLRPRARAAVAPAFTSGWQLMLDAYIAMLPPGRRGGVGSDLIHLHCNRLAPTGEDLIRALAADRIAHHAHRTVEAR